MSLYCSIIQKIRNSSYEAVAKLYVRYVENFHGKHKSLFTKMSLASEAFEKSGSIISMINSDSMSMLC